MNKIRLIATLRLGLERVVKFELLDLGFENIKVSDGRIEFDAALQDIPKANLWLRCADRVLIKMGHFEAHNFDELFDQVKELPWEKWITQDGKFTVNASVVKSDINSERYTQSIVKKAVVERLGSAYQTDWFAENGPEFTIKVSIYKDKALLSIDTSGVGLHKRGYREASGEAPMKETLAAALVKLSFWHENRYLLDPMCGSGTILIEAAMIARNIAPGLKRHFASERWPAIGEAAWRTARREAEEKRINNLPLQIHGYDVDKNNIKISRMNASLAGVGRDIIFEQRDIHDLHIDREFGIVITNPPYGIRLSSYEEMNAIYITLHKMFRKKQGWSVYALSADKKFPDYFKRARPSRVRKLFNGNIEANYYQYYGDKPPT